MNHNKFPIGTDLTVQEDYKLKDFNNNVTQVRKGDRILVTKDNLKYLTGDARGKFSYDLDLIDKEQYDVQNISSRIVEVVMSSLGYDFEELMEERDITKEELIEDVFEELDYFI
ncbi:MAG: hypothetical protein ACRC1T_05060 [Clostridium chrysemydis]|uniref:hypothetical protein n=1 Tax=Clostridium chrysemydis TaxID=2665504 RepID=UPI003F3C26CE